MKNSPPQNQWQTKLKNWDNLLYYVSKLGNQILKVISEYFTISCNCHTVTTP